MTATALDPTIAAPPTPPRSAFPPGPAAPALWQALRMARDPLGYAMKSSRRSCSPATRRPRATGVTIVPGRGVRVVRDAAT